jgi:hypothetical protein
MPGHQRTTAYVFSKGGGTIKASKPGEIVWSRVYVAKELRRYRRATVSLFKSAAALGTTPQRPIIAQFYGVSRDQFSPPQGQPSGSRRPSPEIADSLAVSAMLAEWNCCKLCGE